MARRLTDEEVNARQDRLYELDRQIKELQEEKKVLKRRQDNLHIRRRLYSKKTGKATGLALELFGKPCKELTPDELREYNRVSQQRWRERNRVD